MATLIREVGLGSDDSLSWGSGGDTDGSTSFAFSISNQHLLFGRSGATYYQTGLRFPNITIPRGAVVSLARIGVMGFFNPVVQYNMKITAEDVDDPAAWSTNHRPGTGGTPGRGPETTAKVDWDFTSLPGPPTYTYTSDISSVIQERLDDAAWNSGDAICCIIRNDSGANLASIYSRNYVPTDRRARIEITYTALSRQVMIFS